MLKETSPIEYQAIFATSSLNKLLRNKSSIEKGARAHGVHVRTHSRNPEDFKKESNGHDVAKVALSKTTILRRRYRSDKKNPVIFVAFDVSTHIIKKKKDGSEVSKDLKRISRYFPENSKKTPDEFWSSLEKRLKIEEQHMMHFCTNGVFYIRWDIGFAIQSEEGSMSQSAALVVEAELNPFTEAQVHQAFMIPEELLEKKEKGEKPTLQELSSIPAVATGPRFGYVEMIQDPSKGRPLRVFNRDYPERKYILTPEVASQLVKDCALPPQVVFQLLCGSLTDETAYEKPTLELLLDSLEVRDTIQTV